MPEKTRIEYGVQSRSLRGGKMVEEVRVFADRSDQQDWYDYLKGRERAYGEVHGPIMLERTITTGKWEEVERYAKPE